jgi:glucokinase
LSGPFYAGIDLGGTKILTLVADADGRVAGSARLPTMAAQGPAAVVARMVESVAAAAGEARVEVKDLQGCGVSAPGPIDVDDGVITDPPNLPGWHNAPLAEELRERLGISVRLENDANCGAIGEHQFGAGRGFRHMVYLTVSTGIGGGIIIDDRLYAGASGAAGEIGHMAVAIAPDSPRCGAGHPGCLEAFASGTAIANRAADLIAAGGLPRTARLAERTPPLSAEEVYQAGVEGEAEAMAIIQSAGRYLGIGLASIINIFNPQAIIIGGGLVNLGEALLGPAIEIARARSFAQPFVDVRIVEAELGDRSAALGALAVARMRGAVVTG